MEAFKEVIQFLSLLDDLDVFQEYADVHCDIQSAIGLAKTRVCHSWTKHIDIQFYFIKETLDESFILPRKSGTTDNPVDMLD